MATEIGKIIAAISPEVFCSDSESKDEDGKKLPLRKKIRKQIEKQVKDKASELADDVFNGKKKKDDALKQIKIDYLGLAKDAVSIAQSESPAIDTVGLHLLGKGQSSFINTNLKAPIERHKLIYDAFGESLEPFYFWILDTLANMGYGKVDKLIDSFVSSVGSGHFSEMGAKASRMQDEAVKLSGMINTLIKSILNIIYDLREFKMLISTYDDLKSENKATRDAAYYSLKQRWMDLVDAERGNTSLKGLAQNFDYVTLIDAFMVAHSLEDLKNVDINDRVRRILQQRLSDFLRWIEESEREIRKRYTIEKLYLKSQYNSVKLYSHWLKPYLRSARALEQTNSTSPELVNMFNTTLLELTLLAPRKYDPADDVKIGNLNEVVLSGNPRKYSALTLIELKFRSYPEKYGQNYGFRGRVEITFSGYALNEDEIKALKETVDKDNLSDVISWGTGATDESLSEIVKEVESFLLDDGEKKEEKKNKTESSSDDNPFTALFSFLKSEKNKDSKFSSPEKAKKWLIDKAMPKPDSETEKIIRAQAVYISRQWCVKLYDTFKKANKMPALSITEDIF